MKIPVYLLVAMLLAYGPLALAHKPSDSYLKLSRAPAQNIQLQWDIALRDLEYAIGLDTNADAQITWSEVQNRQSAIYAYALSRLTLSAKGRKCPARADQLKISRHVDGQYAALFFHADCVGQGPITVRYDLLFNLDPTHRGILQAYSGGTVRTHIFTPDSRLGSVDFQAAHSGPWQTFATFVGEGIWHIWIGLDHLLFLACLLLPAVMQKKTARWKGVEHFGEAFRALLLIVTAFTIAHSITLCLAVLDIFRLPSRLVEAGIAASIILVAMFNLTPALRSRWRHDRWMIAFAFGLLHGFGFAGVLLDLEMPASALAAGLAGFNIGVELGQLAIIAVAFPLAFFLRNTGFYKVAVLRACSVLIILISSLWLYDRALPV